MGKYGDLTGQRFGKLLVIEKAACGKSKWNCLCDCGNYSSPRTYPLVNRKTTSCGCGRRSVGAKHHLSNPTYGTWNSMLARCLNPKKKAYKAYGGAGIRVCDRWNIHKGGSFLNFLEDMGERPEGMTLNRIHGNKVYSKETCEWSTYSEQSFDQKLKVTNISGVTGVSWDVSKNKWVAYISVQKKRICLGSSEYFQDAVSLREDAELKYFGFLLREVRHEVQ